MNSCIAGGRQMPPVSSDPRQRTSKSELFEIAQTSWNLVNGIDRFVIDFDKAEVPHMIQREGRVFLAMMAQTVELQPERTFGTTARPFCEGQCRCSTTHRYAAPPRCTAC